MFAYSLFLLGSLALNLGRKLVMLNARIGTDCLFNQRSGIWAVIGVMLGSLACIFTPNPPTNVTEYCLTMAFCAICGYIIGLLPTWQELKIAN